MIKSNGGIIGPDNVTTGGAFGSASGVFKLGEVTKLIRESKWPTAGPGGFQVTNSQRFNSASSNYLNRTFSSSPTLATKCTLSLWLKIAALGTNRAAIFANSNGGGVDFRNDDQVDFYNAGGSLRTTQVFRDISAWYHIVFVTDTTLGTADDRLKVYVNGVQVTNFSNRSNPSQNATSSLGSATAHDIGRNNSPANYYNGYISEVVFIDGQALDPTSFGEFNSQTGIWVPKTVTGLTFGTNGYYLDFQDSSALGNDAVGSNNFGANAAAIDQSTDTCTNNFATLNPLVNNNVNTDMVFRQGNLYVELGGSGSCPVPSTIGLTKGKWYAEFKKVSGSGGNQIFGVTGFSNRTTASNFLGNNSVADYGYQDDGEKFIKGSQSGYGASYADGNIIGIALDLDTAQNTVTFYKNGASQGSINIDGVSTCPDGAYFFAGSDNNVYAQRIFSANFGSPMDAISSGNADSNGFGNFEYAVPSGYLSLNTKNLAVVLA